MLTVKEADRPVDPADVLSPDGADEPSGSPSELLMDDSSKPTNAVTMQWFLGQTECQRQARNTLRGDFGVPHGPRRIAQHCVQRGYELVGGCRGNAGPEPVLVVL